MANLARKDQEERTVQVNREKLIETLQSNLAKHVEEYKLAIEGYKAVALEKLLSAFEQAKEKLDRNLAKGRLSIEQFDPKDPRGTSDYMTLVEGIQVTLKVPRDYSKEYEAAIDMAKWDVRETLELSHAEFQCFVRDVWDWSSDFRTTTDFYNSVGFAK